MKMEKKYQQNKIDTMRILFSIIIMLLLDFFVMSNVASGQAGPMGLYSLSPTNTINQVEKSNNQLTIYPNPLNDVLNFNVSKNSNIKIYDLVGNIVFEQSFLKGQHSINLKYLSNGLYFIIDDRGGVQKFIKE